MSGKILEVEFFPVCSDGRKMPAGSLSREAQKNLNEKNAKKKLDRLINTNFGKGDLAVHLTYRDDEMPSTREEVVNDVKNYISRLRRWRKAHGLPDIKYIYVIEAKVSKRTGVLRWHVHMVMSGMDRDVAEQKWNHGDWTNARRLQPNENGLQALARYMTKDPEGKRRWSGSKNLKQPTVKKPRDGKITRRGLARIAEKKLYDREYWEKRHKGYSYIGAEASFNNYNGHWYVYVRMRKRD